ncbi:MAG: hypothetical protein HRU23_09225 [Gammaproteobacteria bacterium]|nr:hypothetical protein [Gammaproteobacteria bacterium]
MMIIFGEQEVSSDLDKGTLECPVCQCQQAFSHQQTQPYFYVFFIKTFKLSLKSDFLLCSHCGSCYDPQRLESPSDYQQAIDKMVLLRVLCYLATGYGDTTYSRQRLIDIYFEHTQITIANSDITNQMIAIANGQSPTLPYLQQQKIFLSHQAKQKIILASYQFANQSCLMEPTDQDRINQIGANIDVLLPEIEYLIGSITSH